MMQRCNHHPRKTHKRRHTVPIDAGAFTLIELLICVAIIALLVSMLIPALQKARERSQATKCVAILHAWGLALTQYTADSDNQTPSGWTPFYTYACQNTGGVGSQNSPFVNKLYYCPATQTGGIYASTGMSYGHYVAGGLFSGFYSPQSTPFLADVAWFNPTTKLLNAAIALDGSYIPSSLTTNSPWSTFHPNFHGRHSGYGSVLWYDGHASMEKPYSPIVNTSIDPNQVLSRFNLGFLNPSPSSTPYSTFAASPKRTQDTYYIANAKIDMTYH